MVRHDSVYAPRDLKQVYGEAEGATKVECPSEGYGECSRRRTGCAWHTAAPSIRQESHTGQEQPAVYLPVSYPGSTRWVPERIQVSVQWFQSAIAKVLTLTLADLCDGGPPPIEYPGTR